MGCLIYLFGDWDSVKPHLEGFSNGFGDLRREGVPTAVQNMFEAN